MKKTLLLTLIALTGISAKAQKIELGLNGGVTPYIPMSEKDHSVKVGSYAGARVALNLAGWQMGLGAESFKITSKISTYGLENFTGAHSPYTLYLFGNKLFRLPKSYAYAGLNGGLIAGQIPLILPYTGFSFGVQGGYTLNIIKGFGVNAEASARYSRLEFGAAGFYTVHLTFPVSLGVRYTF